MRTRARVRLVGPLGVVEQTSAERLLVRQLHRDSHHKAWTTSSPREPGRLGSGSAPANASTPSRAGPSGATSRPAEQHARGGERHARLDLVGGRVQDAEPRLPGAGAGQRHEARLADAAYSLGSGRRRPPRPAAARTTSSRTASSDSRSISTSTAPVSSAHALRQPRRAGYRGPYGLVPVAVAATGDDAGSMIARLAEHGHLPADLDPEYVTRHRTWIAAQPGFCGGYHLLEPETGHALSLTMWRDEEALAAAERAQGTGQGPADGRVGGRPHRPSGSSRLPRSSAAPSPTSMSTPRRSSPTSRTGAPSGDRGRSYLGGGRRPAQRRAGASGDRA